MISEINGVSPSKGQVERFNEEGFLVVRQALKGTELELMQQAANRSHLTPNQPFELEAHVGYPGAPKLDQEGSGTVRRLLGAYERNQHWANWAKAPILVGHLKALMTSQELYLSQAHHNCLMTKAPEFSSDTGWHQDVRYWSFERPELVSAWTALGSERDDNGGLVVIPGSHKMDLNDSQFDEAKFFRQDIEDNLPLLNQAKSVELDSGDVLFFHCRLLHRASRNYTTQTKLSLVFTYHDVGNQPVAGTRSSAIQSILVD